MAADIDQLLANAEFYTDSVQYRLVRLPATAITPAAGVLAETGMAFSAIIVDKDEVTLLLSDEALEEFGRRLPGATAAPEKYRLITLDVELDLSLVGVMARIAAVLADAGVSILPYAAFTRDHLLVSESQFDTAMEALKQLKDSH